MDSKRAFYIICFVFLFLFIIIPSLQAAPQFYRNLRITITPQRPASYQGTDAEFQANPTYIQGERASFSVTFTREVRWGWIRLRLPVYIPPECIRATFPNLDTEVTLNHLFWGYYTYTSPVLTEAGTNNHTLNIVVYYTYRFSIFGRTYTFSIPIGIAQRSISVALRPVDIEITSPAEGAVVNTNPLHVEGTVDDNTATVTVNDVSVVVTDNQFSADVTLEEGLNLLTAVAENEYGNTDSDSISITLDTIPPQGPSINIEEGDYTNNRLIHLILSAEGAVAMILSEEPDFGDTVWEAYSADGEFNLSEGEGNKTIYVRYKDLVGNETDAVSDSIILDTTLPQLQIISPENNLIIDQVEIDVSGTFTELNLDSITANDISAVIDGDTFLASGVPLNIEGINPIRVEIHDLAQNENVIEVSIIRDSLRPEIQITNPADGFVTNQLDIDISGTFIEVNLDTITVNGIIAEIEGNIFTARDILLNEGNNTILAVITDLLGHTRSHEINIIRDTIPPQNPTIDINGAEYTNNTIVTLSLLADDVAEMIISENLDFSGVDWEAYSTERLFTLTPADGLKTVYARFRDRALNESERVSSTITLDRTQPVIEILSPIDGAIIYE